MNKKALVVGIMFLFLSVSFAPLNQGLTIREMFYPIPSRNILYVGGGGPGNYSKIQDAVSNASEGDTVFVYNGTYYENIQIGKSINLIGEDKNTTIIDGTNDYKTVNIGTKWVNISGFTIVNTSSSTGRGIEVHSNNNKITGNIISDYYWGIDIRSSRNIITGNIILNCDYSGVNLARDTHNNTFTSNIVTNNKKYGIFMYTSVYNNFTCNNFSNNRFGLIVTMFSNNTKILNNFVYNNERGIVLDQSNALVRDNIILENDEGIRLARGKNCSIVENNISNNGNGIFMYFSSNDNIIKENTFQNNGAGIYQYHRSNSLNTIKNNNFISNIQSGIYLHSYRNTVIDNNFSDNHRGIYLHTYNNNTITGNTFLKGGIFVKDAYQNTVTNNTVNGKPLVFLEDESDKTIDIDAGQIILINCDNVKVKEQNISDTNIGIEVWNTNNSIISDNTISSNHEYGIYIYSSKTTVSDNNISKNNNGIYLYKSSNSTITNNDIIKNDDGIYLAVSSSDNIISDNNIISNTDNGITISYSDDNIIYNNFFNNNNNVHDLNYNIWNISKTVGPNIIGGPYLGGNFWNDYTGVDLDGDGLGDTNLPYNSSGDIHNGGDWLPLVNSPPYTPSNPNPPDGAKDVNIISEISWDGGDPNYGDTVSYDVYFGSTNPPPKIVSNQSETVYNPVMDYNTQYYWMIVAWDNHGASSDGPVWNFTTMEEPESDLYCDGSLNWDDVKPGSTVEGSFTVENIGNYGSFLDWEVVNWPNDWGTWKFTPLYGDDLTPEDGRVTVNVSVVAPDKKNSEFLGDVIIVNVENMSDNCSIPVYLKTPRNKSFNFIFYLFEWLFERFPMLERLLLFVR